MGDLTRTGRTSIVAIVAALMLSAVPVVMRAIGESPFSVVFVSRQIPARGSVYMEATGDMPGVGPWSRFRPAAPGTLLIRESNGLMRTLVDGHSPNATTFNLIDVNAPDVSYDGTMIVFAGLPAGQYDTRPTAAPGQWRLFTIRVDGTGLRQLTTSDQHLEMSQFGSVGRYLSSYDDTDPVWLPDGRIVFSSTRWPAFAQYSGVRATNLYVVNTDGTDLHRITSERNGADRPVVDPITGKIVFARWWRNHRFALDDGTTVADPAGGYIQRDGLTADRDHHVGGASALFRNAWQLASINPDGTDLAMWSGTFREEPDNHGYGGAFSPSGELYANFFPMFNMSEAAGFGGVRVYRRGPVPYAPVVGVTALSKDYVQPANPPSFGIFRGSYAGEPDVLPDGKLILSWARDVKQDYGLYVFDVSSSQMTLFYDAPGTTELRGRIVRPRSLPPILTDRITTRASPLPPTQSADTYTQDGTFLFDALNVYGNAPVDTDIVNAPPVGSASTIRFFLDHQRTSPGSFPNLDWPILLASEPVNGDGSVRHRAPANVPLFEQLRSEDGTVPLTRGPLGPDGAAHVAGMNYAPPNAIARCIGCHAGHSMIPVPADPAEARWSNLAPGATVIVSTTRDPGLNATLIDRRVLKGEAWRCWTSAPGETENQWVELVFPVPVLVRSVKLYNPRSEPANNSDLIVQSTTVRLYGPTKTLVGVALTGPVSVEGTEVRFDQVLTRSIRVSIDHVTGTFEGKRVAGLAEIEVIAAGVDAMPQAR